MDFSRRMFLGDSATAAAATVIGGGATAAHAATVPAWTRRPVRTQSGLVTGGEALLPGVTVYKGIPYGATTAGANVWTAAGAPDRGLPVLVWAYGGRDSPMRASQPLYDGSGLARKGLIGVTFNRRIGPFGCLATSQLTAGSGHDASGNYVLMDAIAALEWIREKNQRSPTPS